jgi:hypothetical protein
VSENAREYPFIFIYFDVFICYSSAYFSESAISILNIDTSLFLGMVPWATLLLLWGLGIAVFQGLNMTRGGFFILPGDTLC